MRVALHSGQLSARVPGGIGRVVEMLSQTLPATGADVVCFGEERARHLPRLRQRWQRECWQRARRPAVRIDCDVCHAPSLDVPPVDVPLVVSVHDVAFLRHPGTFTRHGVRFHERGLDIARREAAAVLAPSHFTREELVRAGFSPARVHYVPLGVALPPPRDVAVTARLVEQLGVTGPFVLAVGTVEPRKGHAVLVGALRELRSRRRDASLVVAGPFGWSSETIRDGMVEAGVHVLGAVPQGTLDALYRHASIVASASIYEGFGLPILEAFAHGRAVVASNIPAHAELAGDAARLVEAGDASGWSDAFEELLDDAERRRTLELAGRARAEHYLAMRSALAHLAVYESVARTRVGYAEPEPGPHLGAAQRRHRLRRLFARRQGLQQPFGDRRDLERRRVHRLADERARAGHPAHLAYELFRRRFDLDTGRRGFEPAQLGDVSAHAAIVRTAAHPLPRRVVRVVRPYGGATLTTGQGGQWARWMKRAARRRIRCWRRCSGDVAARRGWLTLA